MMDDKMVKDNDPVQPVRLNLRILPAALLRFSAQAGRVV